MEEMRSFGYICPHCGKAVLHQRSVFALSAAAARMECECGQAPRKHPTYVKASDHVLISFISFTS